MKLYADDQIEKDLETIAVWANQWKMLFYSDITKQAAEVIFSVKNKKPIQPELIFNRVPVVRENVTKHLGVYLDERLFFAKHIRGAIIKAKKSIALLKLISKYVSRNVLNMAYKLYIRSHLDYGDVIFHNQRVSMMNLIEQVQYKAALIVTGCWQGTSRDKLYDEVGWELLSDRWFRRLSLFYKISNGYTPSCLSDHIPNRKETHYNLRRKVELETPIIRT